MSLLQPHYSIMNDSSTVRDRPWPRVGVRGSDGEIPFSEWHPVGVEEYGYAAPDPLDPDIPS